MKKIGIVARTLGLWAFLFSAVVPAISQAATQVYSGELLDLQAGYCFFTTGDAYRLSMSAVLTDDDAHSVLRNDDVTGRYAQATFAGNTIISLDISSHPFGGLAIEQAHPFAVMASAASVNPELTSAEGYNGAPVLVTFTVQIPTVTAFSDSVYLSTEESNWDPMAIRMDRIDALHYRITRPLLSGTHFTYRYTRGSWRSAERGRDGLEEKPRSYVVHNLDVARRNDTVYHWSDESLTGTTPVSPDSIPTPLNGRPFTLVQ